MAGDTIIVHFIDGHEESFLDCGPIDRQEGWLDILHGRKGDVDAGQTFVNMSQVSYYTLHEPFEEIRKARKKKCRRPTPRGVDDA